MLPTQLIIDKLLQVKDKRPTGFSEGDTIFYGHLNAKAYGLIKPDPTLDKPA